MSDLDQQIPVSSISKKFHNTLAKVIEFLAEKARKEHGIDTVVFVGGVFLNKRLLQSSKSLLEENGFEVLQPVKYSSNDESISLGQIAYALNILKSQKHFNSPGK